MLQETYDPANIDTLFEENYTLESLWLAINTDLNCVIDLVVPVKEITITPKLCQPWFNDESKLLKNRMRGVERKWLKYKLDSLWVTCKLHVAITLIMNIPYIINDTCG